MDPEVKIRQSTSIDLALKKVGLTYGGYYDGPLGDELKRRITANKDYAENYGLEEYDKARELSGLEYFV